MLNAWTKFLSSLIPSTPDQFNSGLSNATNHHNYKVGPILLPKSHECMSDQTKSLLTAGSYSVYTVAA